jgi:DNA-binding XRE family transcriptional regulator
MAETHLRSIRYQRGETQRDVANAIGCTQQCVYYWENAIVRPRPRFAKKLSDHFARPIAELLAPNETTTQKGGRPRSSSSIESA